MVVDFAEPTDVVVDGGHELVAGTVSHLGESVDDITDECGLSVVSGEPPRPTGVVGLGQQLVGRYRGSDVSDVIRMQDLHSDTEHEADVDHLGQRV